MDRPLEDIKLDIIAAYGNWMNDDYWQNEYIEDLAYECERSQQIISQLVQDVKILIEKNGLACPLPTNPA